MLSREQMASRDGFCTALLLLSIVADPCAPDLPVLLFHPGQQPAQRHKEGFSQGREPVLHARQFGRELVAREKAVALQVAQGLREHPLGDLRHRAPQRAEAARPPGESEQEQSAPLAAEMI